jgi:ubiquinone/menaquinone biosynthesis C-methylase UbiE
MAQLDFDEGLVESMEVLYNRRDVLRRRRLVHQALDAQPGERVLDVGCGPGFYVTELLNRVGSNGWVTGIDTASAMLAVAAARSEGHPNVTFRQAGATEIPAGDCEFDAVLSVQVLEYVPDVTDALAEIYRVLRPGGRVVIWDVDWTTVSWRSGNADRMRRMLAAWDSHLTHPALPQVIADQLRQAGFDRVEMDGHAFATVEMTPEAYGGALVDIIFDYAVKRGGVDRADARGWWTEQRDLNAAGEFYFACVQCCFTARIPD